MEFQLEHPDGLTPVFAMVIDDEVIATMQLPIDMAAAILSGAKFVGFYREGKTSHVNAGVMYKDDEFVFPEDWKEIDGIPTPPAIWKANN